MTARDCGTRELIPEKISKIRKAEAAKSAELLEADYHCLEFRDIFIMYDQPSLRKVIKLVRQVQPTLVLTDRTTLLTKLKKVISRKADQIATSIISQLGNIPSAFIKTVEQYLNFRPVRRFDYLSPIQQTLKHRCAALVT